MKNISLIIASCCLTITGLTPIYSQNIYTVVGNGSIGWAGDGGFATAAELYSPNSVKFDRVGNYYIADEENGAIRMVNINTGIISTIAGNGTNGYGGDGGPATAAAMNWTQDVAFDSASNMYISDRNNNRVRVVNHSTGIITTFAGNGVASYSGDGGFATAAEINAPRYIAIDAHSNLYIADQQNNRIRIVNISTGIIATIVGTGASGYSGDGSLATAAKLDYPYAVTFDNLENLYIGDQSNYCVREVNHSTGIITTVAGTGRVNGYSGDGGAATVAELSGITGISVGNTGNIYIADTPNNRIRKVASSTGIITTIIGSGIAGFSGDGGPATAAEIHLPNGVVLDTCGTLYFPDWGNERIRKIDGEDAGYINGHTQICLGSQDTLTAIGGTMFLWSTGDTSSSIIVNPTTTTIYSVHIAGGCLNGIDTSLTINVNTIPTVMLSGNTLICGGDTTTLRATGGTNYLWSNGSTFSSITVNPTSATIYSVIVTDGVCRKDTSIYVSVNSLPPVSLSGNSPICKGDSTTLNASGGILYSWSTGATVSTITEEPDSTTTYLVSVSNGICSKDTSITITVNALPNAIITGNSTICLGDSSILTVTGGISYLWTTGATSSTISVIPITNTTYSVTVNNGSCSKDTSIVINVNTLTATVTGPLSICYGDTAILSSSGGGTYSWNTGSTASSILVHPGTSTTYSVTIVSGGCRKDTNVTVTVNPKPNVFISGDSSICRGDSAILKASGGGSYLWSTGQTSTIIAVIPSSTSIYSVFVTNSFGCKTDTSFRVKVALPTGAITGQSLLCLGDSLTLTATGGGTYLWSTGATASSIGISPSTNSIYSVIVNNGCADTVSQTIYVDNPSLYVCCDTAISGIGTTVILSASGSSFYYWTPSFGILCDSCPDPIVNPSATTTYTVVGIDSVGCRLSRTITVEVLNCLQTFIPNVFTPNRDNVNVQYVIQAQFMSDYSIMIYDRWGKVMYQSDNPDVYWNGNNQQDNEPVPAGVYYYIIKYTCNAKSDIKNGFVEVIR